MSNWYTSFITANEELLKKYFDKEENKEFIDFENCIKNDNNMVEITIHGPSVFLDEIGKMVEENPNEYILWNYHISDVMQYDGEYWVERKNGEIKEWVDRSKVEEIE